MLRSTARALAAQCKTKLRLLCAAISTNNTSNPIKTVDLAYASTENTELSNESRPPLVILHGLFGSKNNWNSISKVLHKECGRKITRVDARNHGDSGRSMEHTYMHMAEDIVELMKKLEIKKIALLGHSMGGRTAMVLSLVYPDLVSSLIVADISPVSNSSSTFSLRNLLESMESVSLEPGIPQSKARQLADSQLKENITHQDVRNFLLTNLIRRDSGEYEWKCNLTALRRNFEKNIVVFPESLGGLRYTGPTLFVGGMESDYIVKNDLPKIREYFPSAELQFIDGAGHIPHAEKPQHFINVVKQFLNNK